MTCLFCCKALKSFADSRRVIVRGETAAACADLDACDARKRANEQSTRDYRPEPRRLAPVLEFPRKTAV